jgi:transcription elongation factor S-II
MNSSCDDKIRFSIVKMFEKVIDDKTLVLKIEKGIFNYVIDKSREKNIKRYWSNRLFKDFYLTKIRSVYSNIKKDSYIKNTTFLDRIQSGEIDPEKICYINVYDIFPENWRELHNLRIKRDKLKYDLKPEAMTDVFKCRKCGSRSCSYYEIQTRSADEPMTQFINCLDCGNRWRQ